jgi:hypothetical protein
MMQSLVEGGNGDSSSVSEVLLPRPHPRSEDAAVELNEHNLASVASEGNVSTPSSDRQVAMDAQHVKYHAFSMKWFRKLRDVSRLFIAVDRRSVLLLACLCAMQASLIFLQSLVGPVIGSFYSSIIDNDTSAFSNNIVWALLVFACISILDAALKWLSESMEVMWRRSLASELHGLYSTPPLTSQLLSRIDLTHVCVSGTYMSAACRTACSLNWITPTSALPRRSRSSQARCQVSNP